MIIYNKQVEFEINDIILLISVAIGAAIQAAVLEKRKDAPRIFLKNVTPMSIGILCKSEKGPTVRKVIKRNTPYPTEITRPGTAGKDNQKGMKILIYEGEHPDPKFCKYLGSVGLRGIVFKQMGVVCVDVTVLINRKGELSAKVTHRESQMTASADIIRPKQFKEEDIIKMKAEINMMVAPPKINEVKPQAPKKIKRMALSFDESQQQNAYYSCVTTDDDNLILE